MEEKQLLHRKSFKAIKKFDRQEMEDFFRDKYEQGFKGGFREGAKSSEAIDFKIELVQLIEGIEGKGIGPKTKATILEAYKGKKGD